MIPVQLGDAELLRGLDVRQQDLGVRLLGQELAHERRDAALDEVVAQVHDERLAADERLRDLDRVRQPERGLLLDVGDLKTERGAVADRGANLRLAVHHHRQRLAGAVVGLQQLARVADHDPHVGDAGVAQRLEPVVEDRLVGDRDQLLGAGVGERAQAGPAPSGKHEAFEILHLFAA